MNISYEYIEESPLYTLAVLPIVPELNNEHLFLLTTNEREHLNSMVSRTRQLEYVSVRVLLHSLLGNNYEPIQYLASGKPCMNSFHISISHTKQFVAVIVSKSHEAAIDIEMYRPKIQSIASRFMNDAELHACSTIEDATLVWSAKEVLYKMYNASAEFAEHYTVQCHTLQQKGTVQSNIHTKEVEKTIELSYFRTLDYCLVWGINTADTL